MKVRSARWLVGMLAILLAVTLLFSWRRTRQPLEDPAPAVQGGPPTIVEPVELPSMARSQVEQTEMEPAVATPRLASILFANDQGSPLPGAWLSLVADGVESSVGIAGETATLVVEAERLEGADCIARAVDHKPQWVRMPTQLESTTIVLERLASISGTVRLTDGSPPSDEFHVLAYEDKSPPRCAELAQVSESQRCLSTTTDASGYFSISGLDPHRQYTLSGAGRGYALPAPLENVAPGTRDAQLIAWPLYGIRLVISDPEGKPLKSARDLHSLQGGSIGCMDRTAREVNFANELVLAKIDGVVCIDTEEPDSFSLVYVTEMEKEKVGPISVTIERPGYEKKMTVVRAPRMMSGLPVQEIRLTPEPTATGSVRIDLDWKGPSLSTEGGVRLHGTGPNSDYFLRLPRISDEPYTIEGVPCGDYTCVVMLCDTLRIRDTAEGTPLTLRVLSGETSTLDVDVARYGRLQVTLRDELGRPYDGPATLRTNGAGLPTTYVAFASSPYCLIGLRAGSVTLVAMTGRSSPRRLQDFEFQARVEVVAGGAHDIALESRFQKRTDLR